MDHPAPETVDRLLDAAFARAAEQGWLSLSLAEIAADADVPLAEAMAAFPSKPAMVDTLLRRAEDRMLADAQPDFAESVRDRLFEMVMLRLDALAPYRAGLGRVLRELPADPALVLTVLPGFGVRLGRVLEAAGVSASGPFGLLRVQGLALIYLDTLRVWVEDDSPDSARTMATLDRGLRRAESVMRFAEGLLPPRRPAPAETSLGEAPPPPEPPTDAGLGSETD